MLASPRTCACSKFILLLSTVVSKCEPQSDYYIVAFDQEGRYLSDFYRPSQKDATPRLKSLQLGCSLVQRFNDFVPQSDHEIAKATRKAFQKLKSVIAAM